jgi:hypothetical protein
MTAYPEVESVARCRAFNFHIADKPPGTDFRQLSDHSHRLFLVFSRAHVTAPITDFISLEMRNLIEALSKSAMVWASSQTWLWPYHGVPGN